MNKHQHIADLTFVYSLMWKVLQCYIFLCTIDAFEFFMHKNTTKLFLIIHLP